MATIRSALSLYDGMTGPLQSIHKALNIVLNSFEAVQSASGNAIDSSAIQEAREELARAGSQLDEIQDHIRNAEREQDQFNDRIRDGANATDGLAHKFSKLKTIVATLGISAGIKKLGELSDQFTSTRARLNLIADDGGSVEAVQQKLNTLTQDKTVDVAANIQNNINTTRTEMVDDLANKLNDLNQNATVSVTASDNGTVDAIENRLNELDQAVKVPVDVTDQNSVNEVQTKIDSLTTAVTVDIGTKSTIENQLNQLNRNITVANFIGNVFNDPVGAVARLFFDLADTVLGVLESLASAIDTIFGSNLAGAVSGWRNSLGSWVDSTFGKGEEIMEKMNGDDLKLGRFEYSAAFDLGYKFGEGLEDTVGGLFKTPTLDEMGLDSLDAFDLGNSLDGIYGNTGDTAANTAATADTLDYMDEDLAWMKDIAEREAINRYVTAEITVEQHNENHISKDTDLDGVMDAFCFDFAEKLDISAEGVHE